MNIDQQVQVLIDQAPQYGANSAEVRAIAPALQAIASRLKHPQYFVLQTLEQNWLMTTLTHRTQPHLTKNVVYAFPTLEAVKASSASFDPQLVALPIPIVHILFQMLAMKPIDSVVFLETSEDGSAEIEISRENLMETIRLFLNQPHAQSQISPDIA